MKSFNQIIFLLSYCMFGTVFAMEQEIAPQQECEWFINIDSKDVEKHISGIVNYYDEYKADKIDNNIISFPLEHTDPLPIEYCGSKRFFFTSATQTGCFNMPGDALLLLDPAIKQLAVVRGAVQSNNKHVQIYLGLETENFECSNAGCKKVYPAKVIALEVAEKKDDITKNRYHRFPVLNKTETFKPFYIMEEVQKESPYIKNYCWENILCRASAKKLLGRNTQYFDFERRCFTFKKNYWTQEENKLKGITYNSEDSKKHV